MPGEISTKDKEELAMQLLEIMEKGKDTVAPKISALLVEFAKDYNAEQIAEILNTVPEESGCSVLDWAMSCRMGECEKILLMNGAIPQTNRNWSVLYGKIILASMQEKLGADFHPVFIEHTHNLEQQLSDLEHFLLQAKAIAQTNKSQVNLT